VNYFSRADGMLSIDRAWSGRAQQIPFFRAVELL
jgi:hypothetical protein